MTDRDKAEIFIDEPRRRTPVAGRYDVIVCGGGPAGTAAAVRAAENGASVLLLERQGSLGGTWTGSLMTWLMDVENKSGLLDRLTDGICSLGSLYCRQHGDYSFCPEDMKCVMEQMAVEAGVSLLYHTMLAGVITEVPQGGGVPAVKGVITESKSRRQAFLAPVIVDATGDGDAAAMAGCSFFMGEEGTGRMQPMSMIALVCGLSVRDVRPFCLNYESCPGEAQRHFQELFASCGIRLSYSMPVLTHLKGDLFSVSLNHEYQVPCDDARQITDAVIRARAEVLGALHKLAAADKRWESAIIAHTADAIGVREGRRIRGNYTVTREDLISGRTFEDGICDVTFNVDIHVSGKTGSGSWDYGGVCVKPYQIPLRALIAADVRGLVLAGRLISGDFYAHASYRTGGNILKIGEAAGVLAAAAARTGVAPDEVPFDVVREVLGSGIGT